MSEIVHARVVECSIHRFIANWNENAKPFRWTATPKSIKAKIRRIAEI